VRNNAQAAGSSSRMATYYRVATAGEPASYLWTFSGAASTGAAGGIMSFSGVDTSSVLDVEGGNTTASSLTHTANAITTTVAGSMLVGSFEFTSTPTAANWSSNMTTNQVDQGSITGPSNAGIRLLMAYEARPIAGSTGTRSATASGVTADTGLAYLLALRSAVVVVPAPGSLNAFETATAAGAITGQVYTKLVGTNFALDVVAILGGVPHAAFTDTVQVDLVTGSTGGANCPGTPVAIAGTSQNVNLTSGRGTTGAFTTASAYPDVRVRVRYPVASPTVTSCSTDNFTIRPLAFSAPVSSDMTNTGSSGVPNKKAGDAFNLSVSGGPGYTGTPTIDSSKLTAHAGAIQVGTLSSGFGAAVGGTASGSAFTYSEVGNFVIGINGVYDDAFTNVSADRSNGDCTLDFSNSLVGGRYGCHFGNNTASAAIGRFTPDHFDVALNVPAFTPACGSFTYVGQGFSYSTAPVITVTARNSAGLGNVITRNYTGAWQKITTGSLTYPGGTSKGYRAFTGTLDVTNVPNNPTITPGGAGSEGTITLGFSLTAPGMFFQRAAEVAPFDADISLALNVIDTDSIAHASNPAKFGNEVAGGGMVFTGLSKSMRFGRLQLGAASGSQLVALSLPLEAQYWNGTAFVTNAADNCTSLSAANVGLGNFVGLASGDTTPAVAGAFSSGRKTVTLSPPGGNKVGTVDVVLNLNAAAGALNSCTAIAPPPAPTAAGLAHLRGRWCPPGPNYDRDATARARFGVYRGAEEVIFIRENY
jgi:MSHA biogenesis protein MshQ